jgi:DNA-binding NarL/FixJ family response regulator
MSMTSGPDINAPTTSDTTPKAEAPSSLWEILSKREREIALMLAEGKTNREIAAWLFISIKTVDTHRGHIMQKLAGADVHNNVGLVRFCIKHGFVQL